MPPACAADTKASALADAEAGMLRFSSYRADLKRSPMGYADVLREKGTVGTPDVVAARLEELRETAGLDGVSAEINPGSMLSHAQVMNSLRLWCQEVMPRLK
jgi:alkanesulfonate monooxygenase SsuD/methylene tetrahydromethanopterin reductase-like flavin-dependent oxidoreductase (luciferase family)